MERSSAAPLFVGAVALVAAACAGLGVVGALAMSDDFDDASPGIAALLFGGVCAGLVSVGACIASFVLAGRLDGPARTRARLLALAALATLALDVLAVIGWLALDVAASLVQVH